ncbi:MAG: RHS repeat domain-containing protein [Anaerolineae bacterium]
MDGTLYYVHSDHPSTSLRAGLGSTVAVSDDSRQAVGRVQYDPYGEIISSTLPVALTDRLFTGQRWHGTIGLYQMGARWYDPALGRWLQADTLVPHPRNPQAWNRYSYCLNNPLKYTDSSGHQGQAAAGVAALILELADPLPLDPLVIPAAVTLIASDPFVQQLLSQSELLIQLAQELHASTSNYAQYGQGGEPTNPPEDPFRGASHAIRRGVESLRIKIRTTKIPQFRKGYEAQLRRAEDYYRQGRLTGVEVYEKGSRFDITLMGENEIVEVKYWTSRYTFEQRGIEQLIRQLSRYQAAGKEIILEMYQTATNPLTQAQWQQILLRLQEESINVSSQSQLLPPLQ